MEDLNRRMESGLTSRDPRGGVAGFWALIATQFQGAFSDNALKWLVSFLVLEAGFSKDRRDLWFVRPLLVPYTFDEFGRGVFEGLQMAAS